MSCMRDKNRLEVIRRKCRLEEADNNSFIDGVVSLGIYNGPDELPETDHSFFSAGERTRSSETFTRSAEDYSYGSLGAAAYKPLLAGYSDGEKFHILAYDSSIDVSLACYKYLTRIYGKDLDMFANDSDDFANFLALRSMLKQAGAIWTICWEEDESAYNHSRLNKLERSTSEMINWRDRSELKMFPVFVWEVTAIPLSDISFKKRLDDKSLQEFVRKVR